MTLRRSALWRRVAAAVHAVGAVRWLRGRVQRAPLTAAEEAVAKRVFASEFNACVTLQTVDKYFKRVDVAVENARDVAPLRWHVNGRAPWTWREVKAVLERVKLNQLRRAASAHEESTLVSPQLTRGLIQGLDLGQGVQWDTLPNTISTDDLVELLTAQEPGTGSFDAQSSFSSASTGSSPLAADSASETAFRDDTEIDASMWAEPERAPMLDTPADPRTIFLQQSKWCAVRFVMKRTATRGWLRWRTLGGCVRVKNFVAALRSALQQDEERKLRRGTLSRDLVQAFHDSTRTFHQTQQRAGKVLPQRNVGLGQRLRLHERQSLPALNEGPSELPPRRRTLAPVLPPSQLPQGRERRVGSFSAISPSRTLAINTLYEAAAAPGSTCPDYISVRYSSLPQPRGRSGSTASASRGSRTSIASNCGIAKLPPRTLPPLVRAEQVA